MARRGLTLTTTCFILLLVYTGLIFGQPVSPSGDQNGDRIHTPQGKFNETSTFSIEELERRIIQKLTKDLETKFRTCKALETGLGLEIRLAALEHTVAGLVNTSGVTGETGLTQGNGKHPSIKCPAGYIEFESHCYIFKMTKVTWDSALKSCRAQNSDLVSINSQNEQLFLVDLIKTNYSMGDSSNYWMGLMDTPSDGRVWVDGSAPVYEEWGDVAEPNCMKTFGCKVFMSGYYTYKWEDANKRSKQFSICEIDMTKS